MFWNWQRKTWPRFHYEENSLEGLEREFLQNSGVFSGSLKHIQETEKAELSAQLISDEAVKTSEIEGEYLNRDSVQSSIRREFGLVADKRRAPPAELGIAEMMMDAYRGFTQPLAHNTLWHWHERLTVGRRDLTDVGRYRTHDDPMQIVSGPLHQPKIHFEAPPSQIMKKEMNQFVSWFNQTAPDGKSPLPALTRAGITHLYFVCIHPFEDGNGRIGRALAEKALSQNLGHPTLIALSRTIQNHRKAYYAALERNNKDNEITDWLVYFAQTVLEAQKESQTLINFLIEKTKLFDRVRGQLNLRQEKALLRMFREGPSGFKGGLSAENYIAITKTSRATATRDLQDLVQKKVLLRHGELKSTRYELNVGSVD